MLRGRAPGPARIGRHFTKTIERQLIQAYPKYTIYKDLLAGTLGGSENAPSLLPVLVERHGLLAVAFEADRLAHHVVVDFPSAPMPGTVPWRWSRRRRCSA